MSKRLNISPYIVEINEHYSSDYNIDTMKHDIEFPDYKSVEDGTEGIPSPTPEEVVIYDGGDVKGY